jgi:hypothetical protein
MCKNEVAVELQLEMSSALKGRRMYQPFGSWHAVDLSIPRYKPVCSRCGRASFEPLNILIARCMRAPDEGCVVSPDDVVSPGVKGGDDGRAAVNALIDSQYAIQL